MTPDPKDMANRPNHDPVKGRHYLVTGGAGFIGSHLAEALLATGAGVTVLDNLSTGDAGNIAHLAQRPGFRFVKASDTDSEVMETLVKECDLVFHLAAAVGVKWILDHPVESLETNLLGIRAVLQTAHRHNRPVLITSTSEIYGKSTAVPFREDDDAVLGPTSRSRWSYAASKMVSEFLGLAYHRDKGLPVIVARLFNTVGPRQTGRYGMVIPRFVRQARAGEKLTVYGDGGHSRCFLHVSDAVEALMGLAGHPGAPGQVFNVGSTEEVTIMNLARRILELVQASGGGKTAGPDLWARIDCIPMDRVYSGDFEDMARRVPDISKNFRIHRLDPPALPGRGSAGCNRRSDRAGRLTHPGADHMHFCFDARTATPHFPGIGRYALNLARALGASTRPEDRLFILAPAGGGLKLSELHSGRVTVLETSSGPFSLSQQWALPALLQRLKVDVYHSPYLLMPYHTGRATVLTVHDLIPLVLPRESSFRSRLLFRLFLKAALRAGGRVLTVSETTARDLAARTGHDPRLVTVTPLAPDPRFRPALPDQVATVRTGLNLPDRYVLFLGAARPHKNLARLIRAWPRPGPAVLAVAGPGQPRGRKDGVLYLGLVPDQDLPALLSGADFLVCPSLYEGFGLTVLEAMACGTPVAASHAAGLPEVGGPAALYFNPWDQGDIRRTMLRLLESPELCESLRAKGLTRAAEFTWEKTAEATWTVYRELAGGPG